MKNTILAALMVVSMVSCSKKEDTLTLSINATDFLVSASPSGSHDFFSIENNARVALADSATTKWDFAIRNEKFIFNSGVSGPGNAGVQIVNSIFENVTLAPETGYATDTTATRLAVKDQWYDYNPVTRSFSPKAGKTFVIRTATGKFAKLEMISATPTDNNGVAVVQPTRPTRIKYAMRLAYQSNGTRIF
jgi:HmuY protein